MRIKGIAGVIAIVLVFVSRAVGQDNVHCGNCMTSSQGNVILQRLQAIDADTTYLLGIHSILHDKLNGLPTRLDNWNPHILKIGEIEADVAAMVEDVAGFVPHIARLEDIQSDTADILGSMTNYQQTLNAIKQELENLEVELDANTLESLVGDGNQTLGDILTSVNNILSQVQVRVAAINTKLDANNNMLQTGLTGIAQHVNNTRMEIANGLRPDVQAVTAAVEAVKSETLAAKDHLQNLVTEVGGGNISAIATGVDQIHSALTELEVQIDPEALDFEFGEIESNLASIAGTLDGMAGDLISISTTVSTRLQQIAVGVVNLGNDTLHMRETWGPIFEKLGNIGDLSEKMDTTLTMLGGDGQSDLLRFIETTLVLFHEELADNMIYAFDWFQLKGRQQWENVYDLVHDGGAEVDGVTLNLLQAFIDLYFLRQTIEDTLEELSEEAEFDREALASDRAAILSDWIARAEGGDPEDMIPWEEYGHLYEVIDPDHIPDRLITKRLDWGLREMGLDNPQFGDADFPEAKSWHALPGLDDVPEGGWAGPPGMTIHSGAGLAAPVWEIPIPAAQWFGHISPYATDFVLELDWSFWEPFRLMAHALCYFVVMSNAAGMVWEEVRKYG